MRFIVLLAVCFAAVAAAPRNPPRIVGGDLTTIDKYPSMAALLLSANLVHFSQGCGGTIINSRSVLTAAHCLVVSLPGYRVRVGSSFAHSQGVLLPLSNAIGHPGYVGRPHDHDIAILRTSVIINFNNNVRPAPIAGSDYNLADNQVVWATGWGRIRYGGPSSEQLREVQVWTVNQAICRSRYAQIGMPISSVMLCTGWLDVGGRDQCHGDSGGPVYHNGVVVGVCSFGEECALPQFPGVNARVSSYTSWIQANA